MNEVRRLVSRAAEQRTLAYASAGEARQSYLDYATWLEDRAAQVRTLARWPEAALAA